MKSTIWFGLSALLVFNSAALVFGQQTQDTFEQQQEQEREKIYHGGETQEEKEYYQKVAPQNIEKNRNYFQESHGIKEHPLQEESIPANPLPATPLQENPID